MPNTIEALRKEIEELKEKLNTNSDNSLRPFQKNSLSESVAFRKYMILYAKLE